MSYLSYRNGNGNGDDGKWKVLRDECEDLTDDTAVLAVCFNITNLTFVTASGAIVDMTNGFVAQQTN